MTSLLASLAPSMTMNTIMKDLQLWQASWPINKEREEQKHFDWIVEKQPTIETISISSMCKWASIVIIKHVQG